MKIIPTRNFNDNVEFYLRKKKYKKIYSDIKTITDELEQGNLVGDRLEGLNLPENTAVYKVRVVNSSANVGKNDIRVLSDKQIEQYIKILLEPEEE